ncbi:MAG: gliding motility-associated C-terminal domain-containing protein [Bacteroidales bacterium]
MKIFSLQIIFIIFLNFSLFGQPLEIPVITNVTIDKASQDVVVIWSINNPSAVDGYVIFRQIFGEPGVIDGTFNPIVTISNPNQFSYTDNGSDFGLADPSSGIENYRIASFKVIGGITVYSTISEAVSSFYLFPVDFDLCHEKNSLSWTSYHGFGPSLSGYSIYYSDTPAGTPVLLASVAANDTVYEHKNILSNFTYYYYIEAFSGNSQISGSNIKSVTTTMPAVPLVMEANYATVAGYNQVDLSFSLDANAVVSSYKLLKSNTKEGPFDTIANFPRTTGPATYIDFVKTNTEIAWYKVLAINSCGIPSRESNLAHNILLEASADDNNKFTNVLKWNLYEGWPGADISYTIFRSIDGGPWEEIGNLNNLISGNYSDDVSQWIRPEINGQASRGQFCYYILARSSLSSPSGVPNESKSNISCVQQAVVEYLPNAFNPNSQTEVNRTFKPVVSFVNDYLLIIYNRAGEIVFKSQDPLKGWDGKFNGGELLKKGTYVYYLKYRTTNNQLVEKSGQVNLVY